MSKITFTAQADKVLIVYLVLLTVGVLSILVAYWINHMIRKVVFLLIGAFLLNLSCPSLIIKEGKDDPLVALLFANELIVGIFFIQFIWPFMITYFHPTTGLIANGMTLKE